MFYRKLALALIALSATVSHAQDYKPKGPAIPNPELSAFSLQNKGMSYGAEAASWQNITVPAKTHEECTERYVYYGDYDTVTNYYPISDCADKRDKYNPSTYYNNATYSSYYGRHTVVERAAYNVPKKSLLKAVTPEQFQCMRDQYDAWIAGPGGDASTVASLRTEFGVNKVLISLEDNTKNVQPNSKLEYGPDASEKGVLKLRVVLTNEGCKSADTAQLIMNVANWRWSLANTNVQKLVAPKVDSDPANKACPANITQQPVPQAPAVGAKKPLS